MDIFIERIHFRDTLLSNIAVGGDESKPGICNIMQKKKKKEGNKYISEDSCFFKKLF